MTGNIWMCSHLLDTEDLEFGMHEFITYKMGQQYYGRLSEIAELKTHIFNYIKTKDTYTAYRKSGCSQTFFETHRADITLHKAAKEDFNKLHLKSLPSIKSLNEEYQKTLEAKKSLYKEYRQLKSEAKDYRIAKYDIDKLLELNQAEKTQRVNVRKESMR